MNHKYWQDHEGHPPAALLLLHLDGELEGHDAEAVGKHVGACPPCHSACEQIERGISNFSAFRESVVLPTPAPRTSELHRRFREEDERTQKPGILEALRDLFFGTSNRRLAFVTGVATCALIAGLFLFLGNPKQSVYASQILNDARHASNSLMVESKVLNQKFRLRRANLVIERTAHHGRVASAQGKEPPVDPQLQRSLDAAHIHLQDPLSVDDFSDWRSEQGSHSDSVRETSQSFIITVRVSGSGVTEGSLTLSRSELRPIARSVEFRDEAPIEITEESYSISDSSPANSTAANEAPHATPSESTGSVAERTEPSLSDLENSELDLREAFHSMGADVTTSPVIWRADRTVYYHADPKSPGQKHAMESAASRIAHVKEAEQAPIQAGIPETSETNGPYKTAPPLADALKRSLGDELAVSEFINSLQTRSAKVQGEADALSELGRRYSPGTVKALPPDVRKRVNALASSLLSSLQHDAAEYEKFLAPVLDNVSQGLNVPDSGAANSDNLPGCLTWQQTAALATPQLHDLERNILLMFTRQGSDSAGALKAEELLTGTSRIRSFLNAHLISTCELF
jgi:hypothetical protein